MGEAAGAGEGSVLFVRGAVVLAANFAFRAANREVTSSSLGAGTAAAGGWAATATGNAGGGGGGATVATAGGGGWKVEYNGAAANGTLAGAWNA